MPGNPCVTVVPLHAHDQFDWSTLRSYLDGRSIGGLEHVGEAAYARSVALPGKPAVIELRFAHPEGLTLLVRDEPPDRMDALATIARRALSIDTHDDVVAREHLGRDPDLAPLLEQRPQLRVPGTWDAFESSVRAIVGQQVSVAGATTITGRIVARHGTPVAPSSGTNDATLATITRCFPRPDVLAEGDLAGLGLTIARMATIHGFARAVVDGAIRLDADQPLEAFVASVVERPGLGPWTAHYLALRLGHRDAFPASDLALRRAIDPTNPPGARQMTNRAELWRPWRALAAAHLWASDAARSRAVRRTPDGAPPRTRVRGCAASLR